jgi:ubiquinone/menaquinone biosynthesis C-methylase UbiE
MALERMNVGSGEDRLQIKLHQMRYDFVLARLPENSRVLEVGTGEGAFTTQILPRSGSYIGVEFDPQACEQARLQAGPKAEIIVGDARKLPFGDNQFSFVVCLEVLEHLGDFAAGVRNIHRCLDSSGMAVMSVPYRKTGGKSDVNPYHIYEPGEGELVALFRELFTTVEVHYLYFEETPFMTFARKLHLRRVLGVSRCYADLAAGTSAAIEKLHLGQKSGGMNISLLIVARGKKSVVPKLAGGQAESFR